MASTMPGSAAARATVSFTTIAPSSGAGMPLRLPLYSPMGVRTGWQSTTFAGGSHPRSAGRRRPQPIDPLALVVKAMFLAY